MSADEGHSAVQGRVVYLLILVLVVQMVYPLTVANQPLALIGYQLLYSTLLVAGVLVARDRPVLTRLLVVLGVAWFVMGVVYTFNLEASWALLGGFVVIGAFQGTVTYVLLRFVFQAKHVDRDVLYAASAIYLLLGAIFVPIYGLIETMTFFNSGGLCQGVHAFADGTISSCDIFPWQTFVYYSYATLTTMGYGDVLPITAWARAFASLEAIVGVLYLTVIMARLVGLYAGERRD